jgi:hypothetical protein
MKAKHNRIIYINTGKKRSELQMAMTEKSLKHDETILDYDFNTIYEDPVILQLRESGKRLKKILDIKPEDIQKAIEEVRSEW